MIDRKQKILNKIKLIYLGIIFLTFILVGPPHLFAQPHFMPLRFPHYLETMPLFLGISWPISFEIYHYVLYSVITIGIFNILGILYYPKFKRLSFISSLIGLFLIPFMILFFFFIFVNVNASTAVIYGLYSVILLIVDWLTFKFLTKKQKEA